MQPLLQIKNASRSFLINTGFLSAKQSLLAVNDVSLCLKAGASLGLVGESGCGKSTLGKLACGLLAPEKGEILFQGKPLPLAGPGSWAAGKIQMIFQDPASSLDPRMKVGASIAEPLRALGCSRKEAGEKTAEILEAIGLPDAGNRFPHQFSGGQRQRIAVGRALITAPPLIICDEPVSALDISVQAQILNLLKDMQERYDPAYLFISHDLAVVGFLCASILVMYLGQLVEKAPTACIFQKPAHPYTAALLAAMPKGEKAWERGTGIDRLPPPLRGELPNPLNPPSGCGFHPRCPKARQICKEVAPTWKEIGKNWQARCHFPDV